MSGADTVGSLLADIANLLSEALRMLMFADKRQWGPDEFEQVRALEDALDEAKKDFQELAPLVNGQFYYENDRRPESLDELRDIRGRLEQHTRNFKDWLRTGGPINPIWARETGALKREIHRAQCRVAGRIHTGGQELANTRCLGAFQVYRRQRQNEKERKRLDRERERARERVLENARLPPWQRQQEQQQQQRRRQAEAQNGQAADDEAAPNHHQPVGNGDESHHLATPTLRRRTSLEDLVPVCNGVGKFERFGRNDVAFICDFCDGFVVWEDVDRMPSRRKPIAGTGPATGPDAAAPTADYPNWQAEATSATAPGEVKTIVFAPLAIANHMAPAPGDYAARIICPYCDDYTYVDQGDADEEEIKYAQDERGFPDLDAFQEHLEWSHTAMAVPAIPGKAAVDAVRNSCILM